MVVVQFALLPDPLSFEQEKAKSNRAMAAETAMGRILSIYEP